jgi:hypothetical protein
MMRAHLDPRLALVLFLGSGAVFVATVRRALLLDPLSESSAPSPNEAVLSFQARPAIAKAKLASALDHDPFHPERRRPAERFRLPGEALAASAGSDSVAPPAITLIGTAVLPEGRGFAMCRWGAEPPKLVRIGERVGDLTLRQVERGRALFLTTSGKRLEVRVPKAGT